MHTTRNLFDLIGLGWLAELLRLAGLWPRPRQRRRLVVPL